MFGNWTLPKFLHCYELFIWQCSKVNGSVPKSVTKWVNQVIINVHLLLKLTSKITCRLMHLHDLFCMAFHSFFDVNNFLQCIWFVMTHAEFEKLSVMLVALYALRNAPSPSTLLEITNSTRSGMVDQVMVSREKEYKSTSVAVDSTTLPNFRNVETDRLFGQIFAFLPWFWVEGLSNDLWDCMGLALRILFYVAQHGWNLNHRFLGFLQFQHRLRRSEHGLDWGVGSASMSCTMALALLRKCRSTCSVPLLIQSELCRPL